MRRGFVRACGVGLGRHGSAFPASRAACRSAVYSGSAGRAARRLPSVRQYAGDTSMAAMPLPFDAVDAFQHGRHRVFAFGVQQQACARPHAGDALHVVQRRGGLHHHELPADRAVVVCFPAHAAEHCTRQEHRAAPPAVEPQRARRLAEAQVELEARFDVGERYASQRHAASLVGERRKRRRRRSGRCSRRRMSGRQGGSVHGRFSGRLSGNSRSSRPRSSSATVTPAEGGDLDARAQRRRHVERQACGVEVAFVECIGIAWRIHASACGFAGGRAPMPTRLLRGLLMSATAAVHR